MGEATQPNAPSDLTGSGGDLASSLESHVQRATNGKLGPIEWFRASWQRSGASTGYSTYTLDDGEPLRVMVKLPVGPREYRWSSRLGRATSPDWSHRETDQCPVPRMVDGGDAINGYDLCWLVEERLDREASDSPLTKADVQGVIEAAARFQAAAHQASEVNEAAPVRDWEAMVHKSREALDSVLIPQPQQWNAALKKFQKIVPAVARAWLARPTDCWCHGDLHTGNAMQRTPGGHWVLLDLAMTHAGHWVEDAVYFERQYWHRKNDLCGVKPVSAMARARKALGMEMPGNHAELANLRRVLMAACVPAVAGHEGSAAYCDAALELFEQLMPLVPHS